MSELGFKVVNYVKQESENEFTPFVEQHLLKLAADKSIEFDPFDTEAEAKIVLTKIQRAAAGTIISARKRALYETEDHKWILEVGSSPRITRAKK